MPLLVVCLATILCLTPVACYLLWLAGITRRERPTVVAGAWDFAGLLAGLSGFILVGATLLLTLVQSNSRFWRRGNFKAFREAWNEEMVSWLLVAIGYLVLVIGGAAVVLSARRRSLVIYNIEPDRFEATLAEVFEHLGRPIERRGNLWSSGLPLCELEPFENGKTVTLRWVSEDRPLFQEVERHLRDAVRTIVSGENPASRWLTSAAAGCIIVLGFCLVFFFGLIILR